MAADRDKLKFHEDASSGARGIERPVRNEFRDGDGGRGSRDDAHAHRICSVPEIFYKRYRDDGIERMICKK